MSRQPGPRIDPPLDPRIDPDGKRLPIKLDSTSNGEFVPVPLSGANRAANRLAHEAASDFSKKLGFTRRKFLVSSCGAASTLLAFNTANAAAGKSGGFFDVAPEAALDLQLARVQTGPAKDEFIFDVQGHFIDTPRGPKPATSGNSKGPEVFIKDVFMDSDTDVMVLSFTPSTRADEPVTIQAADAMRRIVDRLEGTHRLLVHGRVNPNQPGDLETMDELKEKWHVSAWKTYTQYGPQGKGYFLSDEVGTRFIEKARALGVKTICVHKGLPFGRQSYEHSQCSDIGVVAKRFPDVNFLIYHSGFVTSVPEQAAHAMGKLIRYCGEDNVLWGTDSIWYGSPQDQIQAFRSFQIAEPLAEKHGYPRITPALRAKVFGRNALKVYAIAPDILKKHIAGDRVERDRLAYRECADPNFVTHGPKTRREFLNLKAWGG